MNIDSNWKALHYAQTLFIVSLYQMNFKTRILDIPDKPQTLYTNHIYCIELNPKFYPGLDDTNKNSESNEDLKNNVEQTNKSQLLHSTSSLSKLLQTQYGLEIESFEAQDLFGKDRDTANIPLNIYNSLTTHRPLINRLETHKALWQDIISKNHQSAVIIDGVRDRNDKFIIDRDLKEIIRSSLTALKDTLTKWDIIFIGHCSEFESSDEQENTNAPTKLGLTKNFPKFLKPSISPYCAFGYVIKKETAGFLASLNFQYDKPLDEELVALVARKQLVGYSIDPPVIGRRFDYENNLRDMD
ncbi:hypothetical protein H4219_003697 [Mycoemilia scoparia]|uniref:Uncharacterized protein n=1 Tax=Mycoemilia scoparia TaxID=417184 RepID=A0A9W7ZUA4_9FUNG|nr:hypothetical protein H4219_003697 [Mycoemilia scoparia]